MPVPRTVTPADDGRTFTMSVGQTAELIVPDPQAPEPIVQGESIEVVPVANLAATGQREWELRVIALGSTRLTAGGSHPYDITLNVTRP